MSRISTLPKTNLVDSSTRGIRPSQIMSLTSSPQVLSGQSSMELPPLASKHVLEKKVAAYVEVVKNLNNARERSFPFKPGTVFKGAYESLGLDTSSGKSVSMPNIWHLIQREEQDDGGICHRKRPIGRKIDRIELEDEVVIEELKWGWDTRVEVLDERDKVPMVSPRELRGRAVFKILDLDFYSAGGGWRQSSYAERREK
ncbi:Nuclear pore complex protein NUP93A [Camellia lanceoleosa]|uniref:Nuclear pore complex protein NUP93A n=1 Tax=Camellia lanceoleosa TaxID=1840588 RepID=A0ACC0FVL7_9ERIC|nr:Nuclear pore complex protein NUP93A [Camellia lanceoleosa]